MHLLMVIRSLDIGGAERQCRVLSVALASKGHTVTLCTLGSGGALAPGLPDAGVSHVSLGHRGPRDLLRSCQRLRTLVKSLRPAVIYSFLPVSNVVCALSIPRGFRARLVWGIRSAEIDRAAVGFFAGSSFFVERMLSHIPSLIIVNSEAGRRFHAALGFDERVLRVVENVIDTATFLYDVEIRREHRRTNQVGEAVRVVVILARVDRLKGYDTFLEAAAQIAAKRADVEFWSVGGGGRQARDEMQRRADTLGLGEKLKWHGEIRNARAVAGLLMASDVGVSASISEGFPNAVAECLACGLRVVGTDVGDTRRIIGTSGECVPVGDPVAMSEAVLRQLELDVPREDSRADFLARFEPGILLDRHEELLSTIAEQSRQQDSGSPHQ